MATKVRTVPVRVNVYTNDYVISGFVHTKPGGYRDRVSDILNDPAMKFLVVTQATFRPIREAEGTVAKRCDTLLINLDAITMLIPFENAPTGGIFQGQTVQAGLDVGASTPVRQE